MGKMRQNKALLVTIYKLRYKGWAAEIKFYSMLLSPLFQKCSV